MEREFFVPAQTPIGLKLLKAVSGAPRQLYHEGDYHRRSMHKIVMCRKPCLLVLFL